MATTASLFHASVTDYFRLIKMKIADREKEFEDLRVSYDIIIKHNDELVNKNDELLEENKRLKKELEKHNKSIAKRKHLIDDFNTRDSTEIISSKKAKQIALEWIPNPAVRKVQYPVTSNGNYKPEHFLSIENLDDIDWEKIPYLGNGIREYLYLKSGITNARELIEAIKQRVLKLYPLYKTGYNKTDITNNHYYIDDEIKISELPFLKDYPIRQGSFKWFRLVKEWISRNYIEN